MRTKTSVHVTTRDVFNKRFESFRNWKEYKVKDRKILFFLQHGPPYPTSFCVNWMTCCNLWLGRTNTKVLSAYSLPAARHLRTQVHFISHLKESVKFDAHPHAATHRQGSDGLNTFNLQTSACAFTQMYSRRIQSRYSGKTQPGGVTYSVKWEPHSPHDLLC